MARAAARQKSKEPRGWRWFLAEFAVVAAGVLAALGAGQAVQVLNWRADAAEARQAVRQEIRRNATTSMISIVEDRCFARYLDRYVAWANGGARPYFPQVSFSPPGASTWEVAKAGQGAAHMPLKEQLAYARYYDGIANQLDNVRAARAAATLLTRYLEKDELTSDERRRMLEDVSQARFIARIHGSTSASLLNEARRLGVEPEPMGPRTRARLEGLCRAAGAASPDGADVS